MGNTQTRHENSRKTTQNNSTRGTTRRRSAPPTTTTTITTTTSPATATRTISATNTTTTEEQPTTSAAAAAAAAATATAEVKTIKQRHTIAVTSAVRRRNQQRPDSEPTPTTSKRHITFQNPIEITVKHKSKSKPITTKQIAFATTAECRQTQSAADEPAETTTTTTQQLLATSLPTATTSSTAAVEHQRTRQLSTWSLGSLSGGRLNWSFSAVRNSFRHRNKTTRKSLTSLQGSRRSKTQWHKPLTNAIFSSHFKETSRNEEFYIDLLVAKGAFGVVFKVCERPKENSNLTDTAAAGLTNRSLNVAEVDDVDHAGDVNDVYQTPTTTTRRITKTTATKFYALKVLKKSKLIEENSIKQIKDEADIQKVCGHHPFIVQQIDLWQNRYNLHILSEYVPNGELFSKISQFSIDLVRLYTAEIALAIDFLHNAGIIYRDAKPENILLTQNYHIKLTDFGLSKWLKLGATTKTMCGTFKYMAPEILRGRPYGHAVDWWALGVIVCQMFTQKSPNIKRYLAATIPPTPRQPSRFQPLAADEFHHVDEPRAPSVANINGCLMDSQDFLPPQVVNLKPEAQDVLKRLLEIDPRQRIHSVLALQRIALYKNFKIDASHLLSIKPLEIIAKDKIYVYDDQYYDESSSELAAKAFHDF